MLIVVAAPLFEGRPEIDITNAVWDHATKVDSQSVLIGEHIRPNCGAGAVYDDNYMAAYYLRVTQRLVETLAERIPWKEPASDTRANVFWVDAWNPTLPLVWHWQAAKRISKLVRHYGIWHGTHNTPGDYLAGSEWAAHFQSHAIRNMDGIFVATNYLRNLCVQFSHEVAPKDAARIHVTGLPLDKSVLSPAPTKDYAIAFCHRWADDKRPNEFVKLAQWWKREIGDGLEFRVLTPSTETVSIITTQHSDCLVPVFNPTKKAYYEQLGKIKYIWANSVLETFGYAILEGYLSGAIPILNAMNCYTELYPHSCYHTFDQQVTKIKTMQYEDVLCNYQPGSVTRMFKVIEEDR